MRHQTDLEWSDEDVASAVAANPFWYHTMDLRPGIVTPGWFDLRGVVNRFPWPDVRGKRCLDIGTYDGFLAFEMERRGAAEVVATDIRGHEDWDFPPAIRAQGVEYLETYAGEKGHGFEVAAKALGSSVRKVIVNVYDLSPAKLGTFDVVVCGALLLHLRDPFRALEAIRSVCDGYFMSTEQVDVGLSVLHRRRPLTSLANIELTQWHVPNVAGHRKMLRAAGFDILATPRPYPQVFGVSHPPRNHSLSRRLLTRAVTRGDGVPHAAVLTTKADLTPDRPRPRANSEKVNSAIGAHREEMARIGTSADPRAVKRSYVDLGESLDRAVGTDVESTPVLSYPENADAVARLSHSMNGRILDAGCGPYPVHSMRLGRDPSRSLVALDIGHGMVRVAVDVAKRKGIELLGVVGDVEALPFRDGAFDGCVCADTIEHLPDDAAGARELGRVLRPGGRLILATPNRTRLDAVIRRLRDLSRGVRRPAREYFDSTSHLREYTWTDLRRLVDASFVIRGWTSVGWTGGPRSSLATRLVARRPFRWGSRMVVYDLEPKR